MAVTTDGSWSFDSTNKKAVYTKDSTVIAEITGFQSDKDTSVISGITVTDDGTNGIITLKKAVLADKTNLTLSTSAYSVGYRLAIDTNEASAALQKATLNSAPTVSAADSSGDATITYTIPEYYTVEGSQITYHAEETKSLGKISGLKSSTSVTADTNGNIKIKQDNLAANSNVSLTPTTENITLYDSSGDQITLGTFLKFQFVDDDGTPTNLNTFGFGTGSDAWDTTNSGQTKTATYQHITPEGWRLNSSNNIDYTGAETKTIATISGFKNNVTIMNDAGGTPSQNVTDGTSTILTIDTTTSGTIKFKIKTSALGNDDLTLTTGEGAVSGTTYKLALADDTGSSNGNNDVTASDNRVGFGNEDAAEKYWAVATDAGSTTKTATYQYDVGEGWELNATADKIVHKDAEPNKVLATITGLSANTQTSNSPATISGITVTNEPTVSVTNGTTSITGNGTIKLDASVFPTTDNSKVELTATNYNLELLDTNLKTTLTAADSPSVAIADGISAGTATVTAATQAYYESGINSYTYHTAKNDTPFATITGLADNAAKTNFTIDDTNKTITLSDGALGNNDITLTRIASTTIAGLETDNANGKYHFDIAITDTDTKATEENQVDPNATKTIVFDGTGGATVKSNTLDWYKVTETAEESGAVAAGERVKYTAGKTGESIATITGLKSGTASSSVVYFQEDNNKQTGTIVLGKDALGSDNILLDAKTSTYKGLDALNLKLAFDSTIVNPTGEANAGKVGFQDSGNYWTVGDGTGTGKNGIALGTVAYQHHTQEGWELIANDAMVLHTNATAAQNILTISGLKESGITATQNSTTKLNEIDGIEVTDDKKILLDEKKLFKTTGTVQIASGGSGYTLALKNDTGNLVDGDGTIANDGKVGFKKDITKAYWRIDRNKGTAYYQYDTSEGWTYNTSTRKIEYTAEKTGENATVLATITGLKSGLAVNNGSISGITVGADGTITLSGDVLDPTASTTVTLTDNADKLATDNGISYKLGLAADVSNVTGVEAGIGFSTTLTPENAVANTSPATNTAKIIRTRKEGWEFADSNNLSMTYKATINDTLATITGLNKDIVVSTNDETAQQTSASSGYNNVNPTHLYIADGSGNYTSVVELDGKSVKLSNAALAQKNTALERGTITGNIKTADEVAYSLVLAEPNTGSTTKVGFDNEDNAEAKRYWHVDSTDKTTAHYQYDVGEGWTLAADGLGITYAKAKRELTDAEKSSGSDEANAAAYSVEAPNVLATVTNLRAAAQNNSQALTDDDLNSGITVTKDDKNFNIVTIDKSVLNKDTGTTPAAVTIDKTDYKLALKGDGDAPDVKDGKIGFENTDYATATKYWTITSPDSNGTVTATYKYDYKEGWTLNASGQIVYTAGGTKELATISGLASDVAGTTVLGENNKYATLNGISVDGNTFKLKESVLNTKTGTPVNITIANGSDAPVGTTYKLAFDGGTQTVKDTGETTLGFEEQSREWTVGTGSNDIAVGSAVYKYTNKQGWTLDADGEKITYTGQKTNNLVTLKGLKTNNNNLGSNIGTAITVSGGIPTATSLGTITINNTSVLDTTNDGNALEIENGNYKLVYDGIIGKITDTKDDTTPTTALNFDTAAGGTVKVKETLAAGWYLDERSSGGESKKLIYKAKVDNTLAEIKGLKAGVTASDFSLNTTGKIVSVAEDALKDSDVTFESNPSGAYKLALKDSTVTHDSKSAFGFDNEDGANKYWATDGAGNVTYQYNVGEGWYLASDTEIKYVKPKQPTPENADADNYSDPVVSAKITGLKSGLTANDGSISGITLGANGKTITVDKSVLGTDAGTTAQLDSGSISADYVLALKDADANGKVGFADSSAYWKIEADDTSGNTGKYKATYQYDTDEGWTITSGVISYSAAIEKPIVTITGLTGLTATEADEKPATIDGITLDTATNTFKLSNSVLGNVGIALTNHVTSNLNATYSGKTYSLGLADDTGSANNNDDVTANDGKVGFVPKDNKWKVNGTTATYQHEIGEGWTLTDSDSDNKYDKITYTGASDDTSYSGTKSPTITLATVSNLQSGLQPDSYGYIDGIDVSEDGTITIDTNILTKDATTGQETTLTLGTEDDNNTTGTYKLAIGGDGEGNDVADGKVGFELDEPHLYANNGTVTYQYNTGEGWTLGDTDATNNKKSDKITYTAETKDDGSSATDPTVLATITGFKNDLQATNGAIDGIDVSEDGKTFTITNINVFAKSGSGATLSMGEGIADGTYKLALGDDIVKVKQLDDPGTISVNANDASKIIGGIKEYAELDSDTQINYHAAKTGQTLATISGLKSDIKSGVTVRDNLITIDKTALEASPSAGKVIELSIEDIADNKDFILDLSTDATNGIDQTANVLDGTKTVTVANGTATIKQPTKAYYSVSQDGKSVNYNATTSKTIAEITGLKSSATNGVAFSTTSGEENVLKISKAALGTGTMVLVNKKVGNTSDHGLKLAFDSDAGIVSNSNGKKAGFTEDTNGKWVVKSGVATYTLDTAEGWTIDEVNNVITYTPKTTANLATIKGLQNLKDGTYAYDKLTGVTVTPPTSPSTTTTFSIAEDLLGTAEVTLTDLDAEDSKDFALKLNDGTTTNLTKLGFDGESTQTYYWVVKDGTVTYQYDVGEGWTVDATTGDIVYTEATTKNVFTVEGLKGIKNGTYKDSPTVDETKAGILKVDDLNKAGLELDTTNNSTINLKNAVLGDNDIKVTTGEGAAGTTYTLALEEDTDGDDRVGGDAVFAKWFLDSTGTAVYNKTTDASWTLASGDDPTSIKYTAAETYDQKPLVKITGLKAGITAEDLNKYIDVSSNTVTLHKDILGTTEVNFTSSKTNGTAEYTLALGGDVEGVTTTEYWTGKNGTMTLKQDASEGWKLNGTKVTYTAKKTGSTLATLSGLDKTLLPSNDSDSDRPAKVEGITVSGNKILIDDAALTTSAVTLKQGKDTTGTATAYSLVYNGTTSSNAATGANWLVAGGTATLKALKPAYYTATDTKITYNAPTAEKTKNAKNQSIDLVYASVKGVSKSATPEDFEYVLTNKDGLDVTNATDKTVTGGTVKVKGDAFNRANITLANGLENGTFFNFKVAIAEDSNDNPVVSAPHVTGSAWTLNTAKTVATMKGTISAGYNVSTDNKTIVYSKPQTGATILTISGLPAASVYTSDNNVKVTDSEGKLVDAFKLGHLDNTGAFDEGGTANIVKMSAELLAKAPAKLTLKGTGYEFAPLTAESYTTTTANYNKANIYTAADTIVVGNDTNGDGDFDDTGETKPGVDVWRVSGNTAIYKRVIPAHFKLTSNNTLVYVKEQDYKVSGKSVIYAQISGIAKGLTVSDDGQKVITAKGDTAIDIAADGKIDIKEPATSTSVIRYTIGNTTGYTLNEGATTYLTDNATKELTNAWLVSGTTAYYRDKIVSAGWAKAEIQDKNKNVTGYTFTKKATAAAASGSKVLAQISGLKGGLVANTTTGAVDGITVNGNNITLDNRVLPVTGTPNRTKVTLTNKDSSNYTLGIASSGEYPVAGTDTEIENHVWSVSGTNVYYKAGTNATWNLDVDADNKSKNTLTLKTKSTTESSGFVTISGLAKGLKVDPATGKVPGIDIDANGVVTISDASVLGKNDVKVTNTTIKLADNLKSSGADDISSKSGEKVWSVSGSNAVLKEVTTAGWSEKDTTNNTTIKYTKETSAVKATITGLKKAALVVKDGKIDGITIGESGKTHDNDPNKIYLSDDVLDNKTVKVTGSGTYTLALAQDAGTPADASTPDGTKVWTINGTTAILKKANTKGYEVKNNGKELAYNNGMTAGSTEILRITGLKRGIAVKSGVIDGITINENANPTTLTLDSRVLGTTNATLTLSAGTTNYKLALATTTNDATNIYAVTDATPGVKYTVDKQGIVTVTDGYTPKGWHLETTGADADKKITYNSKGADAKTTQTLATISGLKSGLKADANGQIAGITYDNTNNTFTLSKDVLDTDVVTITDKDSDSSTNYKLALDTDVTKLTNAPTGTWSAKDGAAVYTIESAGGYGVVDNTKVTYTPKGVSKVVVGGLGLTSDPTTGLTANSTDKTITVADTVLTNVKEGDTVTVSEGYTLKLGTEPSTSWVVKGTTAYYVQTAGANGYLCDGTTITKGKQNDTQVLATITGLPEGFDATTNATVDNGVVTLKEAAFTDNTSNIKVTGAGYTLAIDGSATSAQEKDTTSATWSVEQVTNTKTKVTTSTATLANGKTSYYKSSADGKTLEYKPFAVTNGTEVATITGLKAGVKASALNVDTQNTIKLTKDMLGDSSVSLKGAGYKLALEDGSTNGQEKVPTTLAEAGTEETWTLKGTTLTVKTKPNTYYTAKDTEVSTTVGTTKTLATISGLKTDLAINSSGRLDGVTIDDVNKKVKVSAAVLGTGKAVLNATGYEFALDSNVAIPTPTDYKWSISGTTATLKATVSEGYKLTNTSKEKSIAFVAETTPVVATIEGLKKGLTLEGEEIPGVYFDGETITVSAEALGTTEVKLTNKNIGNFKLALDRDSLNEDVGVYDDNDVEVQTGLDVWKYDSKNSQATYKHVTPAHYELNGNKIKYVAESTGTGIATLTGVGKIEDDMFSEDNVVKIYTNDVAGKDISISGGDYTLDLDPQVSRPLVSEATWSKTGNTAVLKGTRTAGYMQTSDTAIKYTTEQKNQTFASIVGATGTFEDSDYVNMEEERVMLYGADLDTEAVTVSGGLLLDFRNYNEASITGSTGADSVAVDGTGLQISLGGGDDYADLGLEGGNTIIYSGGNDVIADFTATGTNQDKLVISGTNTVTKAIYSDGDAVLTLSDGKKITLKDFEADSITYFDSKGVAQDKAITAADLLESNNFMGADTELGSLIGGTDKLGDLEDTQALTNSDVTTLTKQSSLITYGKK